MTPFLPSMLAGHCNGFFDPSPLDHADEQAPSHNPRGLRVAELRGVFVVHNEGVTK